MEPYTSEITQKTEKRIWITPELELLSNSDIQGGTFLHLKESLTEFDTHGTVS
jgi:hypothetical protein